jgi:hypothetical protein
VPLKGEEVAHDVREKQLLKTATRGVVLLFNAVNKTQRARKEAEAEGRKVHLSKAGFIAQLKGEAGAGGAAAGVLAAPARQQQEEGEGEGRPGWKVLQDSFTGLAKSGKMKDWDREESSDGPDSEQLEDQEGSGDDDGGDGGDAGW